jgi:hypothetical protein
MQKTLTQMNMQLANVLSDASGVTGQAIIKAILAGERDPQKLAAYRDPRVKVRSRWPSAIASSSSISPVGGSDRDRRKILKPAELTKSGNPMFTAT